jgi:hypothetical protein
MALTGALRMMSGQLGVGRVHDEEVERPGWLLLPVGTAVCWVLTDRRRSATYGGTRSSRGRPTRNRARGLLVRCRRRPRRRTHRGHCERTTSTPRAAAASTMAASQGVTPASRFARTPSRTKLNLREPGSARRPRGPRSTRWPARACEWPCLRGCAGARSSPGAIGQTAFEA